MVVIGDLEKDNPIGMPDLVHVYSPGPFVDAMLTREILVSLLEAGNGSFKKGFDSLSARVKDAYGGRVVTIGANIDLLLKLSKDTAALPDEGNIIPTVTAIRADGYRRDPILVQSF